MNVAHNVQCVLVPKAVNKCNEMLSARNVIEASKYTHAANRWHAEVVWGEGVVRRRRLWVGHTKKKKK